MREKKKCRQEKNENKKKVTLRYKENIKNGEGMRQ